MQFNHDDDYKHALFEGPLLVVDHYLIVQRWSPFFLTSAKEVSHVAIWIRIPCLPIKLYNDKFLWRVGSKLGTMLKVDHLTSVHSLGQFKRICVKVDLKKKLVPKI